MGVKIPDFTYNELKKLAERSQALVWLAKYGHPFGLSREDVFRLSKDTHRKALIESVQLLKASQNGCPMRRKSANWGSDYRDRPSDGSRRIRDEEDFRDLIAFLELIPTDLALSARLRKQNVLVRMREYLVINRDVVNECAIVGRLARLLAVESDRGTAVLLWQALFSMPDPSEVVRSYQMPWGRRLIETPRDVPVHITPLLPTGRTRELSAVIGTCLSVLESHRG